MLNMADLDRIWSNAYLAEVERTWPPTPLTAGPPYDEVLTTARLAGIAAVLDALIAEASTTIVTAPVTKGAVLEASFVANWLRTRRESPC